LTVKADKIGQDFDRFQHGRLLKNVEASEEFGRRA
jgi:hypothetical protein